jgi:hypothetical protein
MMSEKKELSKVEQYAVRAAVERINSARTELQSLLKDIAAEVGINLNDPAEIWELSADMKSLERRGETKVSPKLTIPKGKKGE